MIYRRYLKRPLDIVLSLAAVIVLSPLLLALAVLVRLKIGSPVVFKQQRPGLNERIFTIYKFRTMTHAKDGQGQLLPDEARLTPFGRWLRSTSLDELPALLNVLKGDMSLVGPRPLLVRYLAYYSQDERKRHDVRPGLTGWAQVNGRNMLHWSERFRLDLEYVDSLSFLFDLRIILSTACRVLNRRDVMQCATDLEFEDLDNERALGGNRVGNQSLDS